MFIDNVLLAELNTTSGLYGSLSARDIQEATKRFNDDVLYVCEVGSFSNPLNRAKVIVHSFSIYLRKEYISDSEKQLDIDSTCAAICKYYGQDYYRCYQYRLLN